MGWTLFPEPSIFDRLSPREWTRVYRTLGLPEDATQEQVTITMSRLRRKYADDEAAMDRIENAYLWVAAQLLSKKEQATLARQQANRLRELGDSPRSLLEKTFAGRTPLFIREMFEPPTMKHFRWASSLLGAFLLLALCAPATSFNCIGLGTASTLGLIYQRNRPEPVKDDLGNVGEVRKINPKEIFAALAV